MDGEREEEGRRGRRERGLGGEKEKEERKGKRKTDR